MKAFLKYNVIVCLLILLTACDSSAHNPNLAAALLGKPKLVVTTANGHALTDGIWLGKGMSYSLVLTNAGNSTVTGLQTTLSNLPNVSVTSNCQTLSPNQNCTITLTADNNTGSNDGSLNVNSNGNNLLDIPTFTRPAEVNLEDGFILQPGNGTLTLHNTGTVPANIENISFQPGQSVGIVITPGTCTGIIPVGGSCNLTTSVDPNAYGQDNIIITGNFPNDSLTLPATITAPHLVINQGNPIVISPGGPLTNVIIQNSGNFDVSNLNFDLSDSLPGVTIQNNTCTSILNAQASCQLSLSDSSTNKGDSGSLIVNANNYDTPIYAPIVTTGALLVTPMPRTHLAFYDIRLTNAGQNTVTVNAITPTGLPATVTLSQTAPFKTTCTAPMTLTANQNCDIWLHASANQQVGVQTGQLQVQVTEGTNSYTANFQVTNTTQLFTGGAFTQADSQAANYIASWDGSNWSPLVDQDTNNGLSSYVNKLILSQEGDLYVAGNFTQAGGINANYIAKWNGMNWQSVGSGVNNTIEAVVFDASGNLYAGGWFTQAGGQNANRIAKWNGTNWQALGLGVNSFIKSLALDSVGNLYAAGQFTQASATYANYIAKWTNNTWQALGLGVNDTILALAIDAHDNLYAGGWFTQAGGQNASHLAKFSNNTWQALGSGTQGNVSSLLFDNNHGILYVGGRFSSAGNINANFIAQWNGTTWQALGAGLNDVSLTLMLDPSGNLFAGGAFTQAGGQNANYIAKWDGTNWQALNQGLNNYVTSTVIAPEISVSQQAWLIQISDLT